MSRIRRTKGLSARIARELGMTTSAIAQWDRVPAERVPEVARITGFERHELRPDLWEPPVTVEEGGQD